MIVTELFESGGLELKRTYSDAGCKIRCGEDAPGISYDEAIDAAGSTRVYIETGEAVEDTATEDDYKAALLRLGVREEDA